MSRPPAVFPVRVEGKRSVDGQTLYRVRWSNDNVSWAIVESLPNSDIVRAYEQDRKNGHSVDTSASSTPDSASAIRTDRDKIKKKQRIAFDDPYCSRSNSASGSRDSIEMNSDSRSPHITTQHSYNYNNNDAPEDKDSDELIMSQSHQKRKFEMNIDVNNSNFPDELTGAKKFKGLRLKFKLGSDIQMSTSESSGSTQLISVKTPQSGKPKTVHRLQDEDSSSGDEFIENTQRVSKYSQRSKSRRASNMKRKRKSSIVREISPPRSISQHWAVCLICKIGEELEPPKPRKNKEKQSIYNTVIDDDDLRDYSIKGPLLSCERCSVSIHEACLPSLSQRHRKKSNEQMEDYIDSTTDKFLCPLCFNRDGETKPCDECGISADVNISSPFISATELEGEIVDASQSSTVEAWSLLNISVKELSLPSFFCCQRCHVLQHWNCAVVCRNRASGNLKTVIEEQSVSMYTEKLADILRDFHCNVCIQYPNTVDKILTWRVPTSNSVKQSPESLETHTDENIQMRDYFIKFVDESYRQTTWLPGRWVYNISRLKLKAFYRNVQKDIQTRGLLHSRGHIAWSKSESEVVDEGWRRIDSILDVDTDAEPPTYYVKWMGLSHSESTWQAEIDIDNDEDFKRAIKIYRKRLKVDSYEQMQKRGNTYQLMDKRPSAQSFTMLEEQPTWMTTGELKNYQLDGLNWLIGNWRARTPCILADEMGLGKTIQLISFISYIFHKHHRFPFLVVAPNSTLDNWHREFKKWAPEILSVMCTGTAKDTTIIKTLEIFRHMSSRRDQASLMCHVVIVSYESLMANAEFKNVLWDCLVVDESHRLKNDESTPLQNNVRELFNLMSFLNPEEFNNAKELTEEYNVEGLTLSREEVDVKVKQLHERLRPHFLRRVKSAVLKDLPPKAEILVPVQMTPLQRELTRDIYSSSNEFLKALGKVANKGKSSSNMTRNMSLLNLLMQTRKVLSHPFLFPEVEDGLGALPNQEAVHRRLIDSCGKLQLLHKMLVKLKVTGHKVLIFCQFQQTLTILEDYLHGQHWLYCQLDGSVERTIRQERIDKFNSDPEIFVFILTTRAGGVGINLTAADTVFIYDVDWNPHQDIQAISRAHRIGQENKVLAFKFMTVNSPEEKMISVGQKKLALDHIIVQRMKEDSEDVPVAFNDVMEALKCGAKALFEDDVTSGSNSGPKYDDDEIEKLLDRQQAVPSTGEEQTDAAAEAFGFEKVWMNKAPVEQDLIDAEVDFSIVTENSSKDVRQETQEKEEGNWNDILEKVKMHAQRLKEKELAQTRRRKVPEVVNVPPKETPKEVVVLPFETSTATKQVFVGIVIDTSNILNQRKFFGLPPEEEAEDDQDFEPDESESSDEDSHASVFTMSEPTTPSDPYSTFNPTFPTGSGYSALPPAHLSGIPPPKTGGISVQHAITDSLRQLEASLNVFSEATEQLLFTTTESILRDQLPNYSSGPINGRALTKHFASMEPCWLCHNTRYATGRYHVPTRCFALKDHSFCFTRLTELQRQGGRNGCIAFLRTYLIRAGVLADPSVNRLVKTNIVRKPKAGSGKTASQSDLGDLLQKRVRLFTQPGLTVVEITKQLRDIEEAIVKDHGWSPEEVRRSRVTLIESFTQGARNTTQVVQ